MRTQPDVSTLVSVASKKKNDGEEVEEVGCIEGDSRPLWDHEEVVMMVPLARFPVDLKPPSITSLTSSFKKVL